MGGSEPDEGDLGDWAAAARAALPAGVWGYLDGGAGAERTLRANRAAYDRVALRPRFLVDVSAVSLATTVLGVRWEVPFGVAPMAYHRLAHPDGEVASAAAVGGLGGLFVASMFASRSFADMAAAGAGMKAARIEAGRDEAPTNRSLGSSRGLLLRPLDEALASYHRDLELAPAWG